MAGAWWWVLSGSAFRPSAGGPAALPPAARGGLDAPRVHWEQLDVRAVPVRVVRRNPFSGRHAPRAVAVRAAVLPEEVVTPATASDWPRVALIGIRSASAPGGVERIAVLAG